MSLLSAADVLAERKRRFGPFSNLMEVVEAGLQIMATETFWDEERFSDDPVLYIQTGNTPGFWDFAVIREGRNVSELTARIPGSRWSTEDFDFLNRLGYKVTSSACNLWEIRPNH